MFPIISKNNHLAYKDQQEWKGKYKASGIEFHDFLFSV
jgi:hypothetical protein